VSPVRYELGFYIPEDEILHSHGSENLKSYTANYTEYFPLRASAIQTLLIETFSKTQIISVSTLMSSTCR
jgi:hypothetical protein